MTRVTAPIAKLTRSLSTSASAPRPSKLVNNASKAAATARVRKELELNVEARNSDASDSARHLTTISSHRPLPNPNRTNIPLMQTFFSTTTSARARLDTSSIDFAVLPSSASLHAESGPQDSIVRVPLLPDNYAPDRSKLAPEAEDGPLPTPEILIVAANPANVLPAALTEVEGMGIDGVELSFAHRPEEAARETGEGGMLRDLWKGLVEDVLGEPKAKPAM